MLGITWSCKSALSIIIVLTQSLIFVCLGGEQWDDGGAAQTAAQAAGAGIARPHLLPDDAHAGHLGGLLLLEGVLGTCGRGLI